MSGYCGKCMNYIARPFEENICSRSGKVVPYLQKRDCYEERKIEKMEEKLLTTKVCKVCGRELPISEFGNNHKSPDGHLNTCKDCISEKHKASSRKTQEVSSLKDKGNLERDEEGDPRNSLHSSKDEDLVKELRSRGWEVKCSKYVEL